MALLNFLIVDEMHESIIPLMNQIGIRADYEPTISRHALLEKIAGYEGLVIRSKTTVDMELLEKASNLKFIARAGAGLDQLDVEEINRRGIVIINAPEGNQDALAEHAVGMLLCLFNKINLADAEIRNHVWDREGNRGVELMGKTVGLVGYGYMGKAFAKRLCSFDCKILAYDKYKKNFSCSLVEEVGLEEIFRDSDILSLHVPLNAETKYLVNRDFLNKFRKNIYLLNTSRGSVVKLKDLNRALEEGKVLGAALDVIENEKLHQLSLEEKEDFGSLISCKNVLLTPHVAGWSFESYRKINEILAKKLSNLIENKENIS
jgi:D-3-phosphoglycerate dehydrogenase / 2-oxoglutarate reductase